MYKPLTLSAAGDQSHDPRQGQWAAQTRPGTLLELRAQHPASPGQHPKLRSSGQLARGVSDQIPPSGELAPGESQESRSLRVASMPADVCEFLKAETLQPKKLPTWAAQLKHSRFPPVFFQPTGCQETVDLGSWGTPAGDLQGDHKGHWEQSPVFPGDHS